MPAFSSNASQETWISVAVAASTFGIFAACRLASVLLAQLKIYRAIRRERLTFHLTPVDQQCHWGATRQQDDTLTTQISAKMVAKNLTKDALHLLTVRLLKPKIRGEILNNMLMVEDRQSGEYGSVHTTGKHIPAGAVRSVAIMIVIRGVPRQRAGKVRPLAVLLSVADAAGNRQRVKVQLRPYDPTAIALRA